VTRRPLSPLRGALGKDPTKDPMQCAEELRKSFPQLFDFRGEFSRADDLYRQSPVECGEVWRALPRDAKVSLHHSQEGWHCSGAIRDGQWVPEREPVGPMANKLIFTKGGEPPLDSSHMRPGAVLITPTAHLSPSGVGVKKEPLAAYGRAVFVPGQSESINVHGQLLCHRPGTQDKRSSFQFWQSWGIESRPGVELISRPVRSGHLRYYVPIGPRDEVRAGEDTHAAARRLLAEVLGAIPASRPWGPSRRLLSDRPDRGEVVRVTFDPTIGAVPCVVVSPQEMNKQSLDVVVTLRCVTYKPGDEESAILIPIGPAGCMEGIEGRWSVSVSGVRGITSASKHVRSLSPSVRLSSEVFNDLQRRLEYFYA